MAASPRRSRAPPSFDAPDVPFPSITSLIYARIRAVRFRPSEVSTFVAAVVVQGMGGSGKSSIVVGTVRDEAIRRSKEAREGPTTSEWPSKGGAEQESETWSADV